MIGEIVFKKNQDVVTREIAGETILMPLFKSNEEMNYIYTLNETAAQFWALVDGQASVGEIRAKILEGYEVTEEELDREIEALVTDLESIRALVKVEEVAA